MKDGCDSAPRIQVMYKHEGEGNERNVTYWSSDFMGHVSQEFGFRSVCKLGSFSGSGVSLNRVSEVEHHLINLPLQLVHFTRSFDRDQFRKVAISSGIGNVAKCSHLSGQVHGHGVDI